MTPDADLLDGTPVVSAGTAAYLAGVSVRQLHEWERREVWPPHVAERFGLRFYAASDVVDRLALRNPDPRCGSDEACVTLDHRSTRSQGGNPDSRASVGRDTPGEVEVSGRRPSPVQAPRSGVSLP